MSRLSSGWLITDTETVLVYHRLGIAWATSLLGFISLALLPVPWALFKYGPRVRARSGYDTVKFLPDETGK